MKHPFPRSAALLAALSLLLTGTPALAYSAPTAADARTPQPAAQTAAPYANRAAKLFAPAGSSPSYGNGSYSFSPDTKTLTILTDQGTAEFRAFTVSYVGVNLSHVEHVVIKQDVTELEESAFEGHINLRTVTVVDNSRLRTIGANAFYQKSLLESVTIGENSALETIDYGAFAYCSALTAFTIEGGSKLKEIGEHGFSNCPALKRFDFRGVERIGPSAFLYSGLTSVEIPATVVSIDRGAFSSCAALESAAFKPGSKLDTIREDTFSGCSVLKAIAIPDSVTVIKDSAFDTCDTLESVAFGPGSKLEAIGKTVFARCKALKAITIPKGVTSIGTYAFGFCDALESVVFTSMNAPTLGIGVFSRTHQRMHISVPYGAMGYGQGEWLSYRVVPVLHGSVHTGGTDVHFSAYQITAEAGPGGRVAPAGFTMAGAGQSLTVTAIPDEGYIIDRALLDGTKEVALSNGSYTFRNVTEPYTLKVTFKPAASGGSDGGRQDEPAPNPATGDDTPAFLWKAVRLIMEIGKGK